MMFILPVTRGSMMKFFPVCVPMAFTTDGISAFTKFSITVSCANTASDISKPNAPDTGIQRSVRRRSDSYIANGVGALGDITDDYHGVGQRGSGAVPDADTGAAELWALCA